jgi:hypothetical protein
MNDNNKQPMFGPSAMFDPSTFEPRSGKSALMNELMAKFAGKPDALADTIIGNCTTTLPMKFKFDAKDNGHTVIVSATRNGMSATLDALQDQYAKAGGSVQVVDKGPTARR